MSRCAVSGRRLWLNSARYGRENCRCRVSRHASSSSPSAVGASADDAERHDARLVQLLQQAQHVVLAPGQVVLDLLDRDDAAGHLDEADDVPRDAAGQGREQVLGPVLQRRRPGQVEQGGVGTDGGDLECHGTIVARRPAGGESAAAAHEPSARPGAHTGQQEVAAPGRAPPPPGRRDAQSPMRWPVSVLNRCTWPSSGTRLMTLPFCGRRAAVDAGDDRVGVGALAGGAVDVGVGAELLDHLDGDGQARCRRWRW